MRAAAHASSAGLKVIWIDTAYAIPRNRLIPLTTRPELITYLYLPTLAHIISFFQRPPHDLDVSLLVLDELSSPYLLAFPPGLDNTPAGKKFSQRRYPIMVSLAHSVNSLAAKHNAAVMVLQKSATRVVRGFGGVLAPTIGFRGWIEAVGWRIVLFRREGGRRCGSLFKARGRVYLEGEGPEMEIFVGQDGAVVDEEDDESQYGYREDEFRDEMERDENHRTQPEREINAMVQEMIHPEILGSPPRPTPSPLTMSPASPRAPPSPSPQLSSPLRRRSPSLPKLEPPQETPNQTQDSTISNVTNQSRKRKRGIELGVIPDSEDEDDDILLDE